MFFLQNVRFRSFQYVLLWGVAHPSFSFCTFLLVCASSHDLYVCFIIFAQAMSSGVRNMLCYIRKLLKQYVVLWWAILSNHTFGHKCFELTSSCSTKNFCFFSQHFSCGSFISFLKNLFMMCMVYLNTVILCTFTLLLTSKCCGSTNYCYDFHL